MPALWVLAGMVAASTFMWRVEAVQPRLTYLLFATP